MKSWNPLHRSGAPGRALTIEAGQVVCPNRGVVDIEDCWTCPAYLGLSTGSTDELRCTPGRMAPSSVGGLDAYPAWLLKR